MSSHKHKEHLEKIKDVINTTDQLDENQKSSSVKLVEEWYMEDKAMDTLKNKLLEISIFFEEVFSELGLK